MEDGLTRICGGDGTAMEVEAEVGEQREDRRSHAKRWWTGLTRICGGDGTAMEEKRYVADLWKARPICGGSVEEEGWQRRSNKMGGDGGAKQRWQRSRGKEREKKEKQEKW
jgi:hypothetical protein